MLAKTIFKYIRHTGLLHFKAARQYAEARGYPFTTEQEIGIYVGYYEQEAISWN